MDNLGPSILDISSDEETSSGERGGDHGVVGGGGGGGEIAFREDLDLLSKPLEDDSDDVYVVSESFPKSPKKSRPDISKPLAKVVDDEDDDDCVILDGDPDRQLVVVNNKVDDDSDDLEIVGEKGEVPGRHFPHARHLCANFNFASTPHDIHCEKCYCYVCDSKAPCSQWGTGVNSADHCNASDKVEYWKAERQNVKKSCKPVSQICGMNSTRIESFFQSVEAFGCALSKPNHLPQNQSFTPVTVHPCSQSSNVDLSNVINRGRSYPVGRIAPRYNPPSNLVSGSHSTHSRSNSHIAPNVAFRSRNHHVGNQSPQSFPPRAVFKRNGVIRASTNNRQPYRFQSSRVPPLNRHPGVPAIQAPITSGRHGSNQQITGSQAAVSIVPQLHLPSPHSMDARHANYSPFEPRINSQPSSSIRKPNSVPLQSQMPFQPFANGNSLSSPPLQPCIYSQPSVGNINSSAAPKPYIPFVSNNPVPSHIIGSFQSDAGNTIANQLHSRSTISSHSIVGNDFDSASSQLQARSNPTSPLIGGQNDVQQQLHTENGMFESQTDFGFFCDSSANHGNMQFYAEQSQYPSTAPAEISQIQNKPEHDQPSIAPVSVDNLPRQSVELAAAYTSPINDADCLLPESKELGSLDFNFDNWMMYENQSFSGAMGAYSPEPAFSDRGTLFDN